MKTILLLTSGILCCHAIFAQSYSYTTIKTPTNVTINALLYSELSPADLSAIESNAASWTANHGSSATRVAPATITYNCHGYAWHVKDGGSAVWINAHSDTDDDPEELSPYWSGSSPTYTSATSADATVAFYGSCWSYDGTNYVNGCDHSAKVISPTLFESKWGAWPRFQHAPADCPYPSSNIQYYKIPLTGANTVCSSGSTYSTLNISGASYSWSGSNVSVSGSSYSGSASANGSGRGSVQVNIASSYSGTTVLAKKGVWVGNPSYYDVSGLESICSNYSHQYNITNNPYMYEDQATYTWSSSSSNLSIVGSGPSVNISSCCPGTYIAYVSATNSCGTTYNSLGIDVSTCFARYSIFPNPASDYVQIEFDEIEKAEALPDRINLSSENSSKPLKSIDVQSMYEKNSFENGRWLKILTKDLPRGTYYLQVENSRRKGKELDVVRVVLQ